MRTRQQWVDLGVQTDACLVIPDSCGPEGAAVAFWVNIYYCSGIMSSYTSYSTGFFIYCFDADKSLMYVLYILFSHFRNIFKKLLNY